MYLLCVCVPEEAETPRKFANFLVVSVPETFDCKLLCVLIYVLYRTVRCKTWANLTKPKSRIVEPMGVVCWPKNRLRLFPNEPWRSIGLSQAALYCISCGLDHHWLSTDARQLQQILNLIHFWDPEQILRLIDYWTCSLPHGVTGTVSSAWAISLPNVRSIFFLHDVCGRTKNVLFVSPFNVDARNVGGGVKLYICQ